MTSTIWLEIGPWGNAIGWTLVHSLWQISLIALSLALALRYIPQRKPELRYGLLLVGLLAATVWSGSTFLQVWNDYEGTILSESEVLLPTEVAPVLAPAGPEQSTSLIEQARYLALQLDAYMPTITFLWLLGMLLFSLYLFAGLLYLKYLQHHKVTSVSVEWQQRFEDLCQQMGIKKKIGLFISKKVEEPITFRFLQPVILVPVSFFTGLTAAQIEVLLLHELAHIRRYDFAVNLLQTLVEILFFYHPALWWISGKIREEREHCCDDAVLAVQQDPVLYAEALTRIQLHHFSLKNRLAMSANGKKSLLSKRVFRLFGKYDQQPSIYKSIGLALLLFFITFTAQAFLVKEEPISSLPNTYEEPIPDKALIPIGVENDTTPLFVVDGKMASSSREFDSKKLNISPDQIEKIQVIRDQAAIDKYGETGRYGVVEITMKEKVAGKDQKEQTAAETVKIIPKKPALDLSNATTIKGTIYDENQSPLIGSSILLIGTSVGTVSDFSGEFQLRVPENCPNLAISYIGYKTKVVADYCNGEAVEVIMEKQAESLEMVTISAETSKPESLVVNGNVVDENGAPLIGVSILIDGTKTGAISDLDGDFELTLPTACATLVFRYVGMDAKVIEKSCGGQHLEVILNKKEAPAAIAENQTFSKFEAYPNPSSGTLNTSFTLDEANRVKLSVFSLDGKLVETLIDQQLEAGPHQSSWNAPVITKGTYLLQLEIKGELFNKQVVIE